MLKEFRRFFVLWFSFVVPTVYKTCKESCDKSCFKVIDSAKTYNQLKVKEVLHILWEGPNLNKQVQHYNFSLSF